MSKGLIILDRDGVLNKMVIDPEHGTIDSPLHPDQVEMIPESLDALTSLYKNGWRLVVATNQPAFKKGKTSKENLIAIQKKIISEIKSAGAVISDSFICWHTKEENCNCRKPNPGLLLQAKKAYPNEWKRDVYMVGDGLTDVKAGQASGTKTALIGPKKFQHINVFDTLDKPPDFWFESLSDFANQICKDTRPQRTFSFGKNWESYSKKKLNDEKLLQAKKSIESLVSERNFIQKSFIDVGCGSGIFTLAASELGASPCLGVDVDPDSIRTSEINRGAFSKNKNKNIHFKMGSALDQSFMNTLGQFDIVYAWGSLHHSGDMWTAIQNTSALVKPDGVMVLSIYGKSWSSPIWKAIKWIHSRSPAWAKRLMEKFFAVLIYLGVWVLTRSNPLSKERGMSFWFDVIDWVGGYPYEYASKNEVINFLKPYGFDCLKTASPRVSTGCIEYVFEKKQSGSRPKHEKI